MALAQTLTTMYEYHDYWETLPSARYTVLPNGVKHGTESRYRENGTLSCVRQWNRGEQTAVTYYYVDGKTPEEKLVWSDKGKVEINYDIMGEITFHKEIEYSAPLKMVYYKTQTFTYSLSKDRKIATLKTNDKKLHTTYNFDKDLYTIINAETTINNKIPVTITNGVASFTLTEDLVLYDHGKMYCLKKGDKGQFKVQPISMDRSTFQSNQFRQSEEIRACLCCGINLPDDFISKNFQHRLKGLLVKYNRLSNVDKNYYLIFSGDINNGVLVNQNDSNSRVVMQNGQPVEFTYGRDQIQTFHSKYDKEGALFIFLDEGTLQRNGVTYSGTFLNGELVNGKITKERTYKGNKLQTIYEGQFENYVLVSGKMTQQDLLTWHGNGSVLATIVHEGQFNNDQLINGNKLITTQGDLSLTITSQVTDRNTTDTQVRGVLTSGMLNVEKYFSNPKQIYFDSIHYTHKDQKVRIYRSNGDTFEGQLSDNLLKSIFDGWAVAKNNDIFVQGTYVSTSGDIYEGTFAAGVLSSKTFHRSYQKSGTTNIRMTNGRYVGSIFRNKKYDVYAQGHGTWYIDGGNVVTGEFVKDVLQTKQPYKLLYNAPTGEVYQGYMLAGQPHGQGKLTLPNGDYIQGEFVKGKFTGNGQVKCTYKKGSFEGQVINFAPVQGDENARMTKYLKSIKLPKIVLPKEL